MLFCCLMTVGSAFQLFDDLHVVFLPVRKHTVRTVSDRFAITVDQSKVSGAVRIMIKRAVTEQAVDVLLCVTRIIDTVPVFKIGKIVIVFAHIVSIAQITVSKQKHFYCEFLLKTV